ncbi:hypothetical protein LLS04_07175 [Erysipelothrix enhydrae]|uniref:hypothetical protein n=1 Tax=Erysipelothrix enhydrae TaxID=2890314 RepID=UPI002B24E8F3|nr:hypothetical protein [Erysipelothrix sp. 4322-04]WRB86755.1 hypothetical protein LLS04_07175 [Erysipelothrix sp. 4322-04]
MKKIINGFLSLIVIVFSMVLVGTLMVQSQLDNLSSLVEPTFVNVESQVAHYFEPIRSSIPETKQAEFDALQEQVISDPKFQEISETLVTNALNDVVSGGMSMNETAFKEDVQAYIESYAPEIETLSEGSVSVEEVSAVVEETLNNPEFQQTYETIVTRVQQELSPKQQRILSYVNGFTKMRREIITGTILILAVTLLILVLMNRGWQWSKLFGNIAMISSIMMLILYLVSPFIMTFIQNRVGMSITIKHNPFKLYLWSALGAFGMGIIFKIINRFES